MQRPTKEASQPPVYWCTDCGQVITISVKSNKHLFVITREPEWCPFCGNELYEDDGNEEED